MRECNSIVWIIHKENQLCAVIEGKSTVRRHRAGPWLKGSDVFPALRLCWDRSTKRGTDWPELGEDMDERLFGGKSDGGLVRIYTTLEITVHPGHCSVSFGTTRRVTAVPLNIRGRML